MRSSWGFFANLSFEDAERILKEKGFHGSYLCRRSASTPGSYTLSVRRRNDVWHFRIYNDGESFELYENDGFASVPDMIEFYRSNPAKFIDKERKSVELTEPVLDESEDPGLEHEKWFFGEINRGEAEKYLKEKGEHGSYLVRESRSQPGNFVLSVRNGSQVIEFLITYIDSTFDIASAKRLKFPSMNHLLDYYTKNPLVDKTTEATVILTEGLADTAERLGNEQRIKKEFEWLQQEDRANTNTKHEGSRPENKVKNRYRNILPFDHTRVVLRNADPAVPFSDYINSSYIFDDTSGALFIASQGCVRATVDDFWQMIYQENTRIIIMVTNEVEKAKIKCVRYWPEPGLSMIAADKQVSNAGETSTRDYIVRQLEIHVESEPGKPVKPPRKIFHYQFVGWPDHGVPNDPGSILEMMQLIEATQKTFEYPGPPVIHCSAGIGRTGTMIVTSMLMSLYRIKGHLEERDIPRTVQKVRLQRSGMVQTEEQYRFIYASIVFYMDTVEQRHTTEKGNRNSYGNLDEMSNHMEKLALQEKNDKPPDPLPRTKSKSKPAPTTPE